MAEIGTKEGLLEVGAVCFAAKGYQNTSVREICHEAEANIAAVNYHFGGKMEFYKAVLIHAFEQGNPGGWPPPLFKKSAEEPLGQLHEFIEWFVERMLGDKGNHTTRDLLHHELREPTGALNVLVDRSMKPLCERLAALIKAIIGKGCGEKQLRLCLISIMGQCLVYKQCLPMLERVYGSDLFDSGSLRDIADHVFHFSLAGLRAQREGCAQ